MRDDGIYVTYLPADRVSYQAGYVRIRDNTPNTYEHTYSLSQDLKIPSRATQYEAINKVVRNNKNLLNEGLEGWIKARFPVGSAPYALIEQEEGMSKYTKRITKEYVKSLSQKNADTFAFDISQSLGVSPDVRKAIIKELKAQGYNAMVDEASVGGQNEYAREGIDPLIVFDSDSLITKRTRKISRRKEQKANIKRRQMLNRIQSAGEKFNPETWEYEYTGKWSDCM